MGSNVSVKMLEEVWDNAQDIIDLIAPIQIYKITAAEIIEMSEDVQAKALEIHRYAGMLGQAARALAKQGLIPGGVARDKLEMTWPEDEGVPTQDDDRFCPACGKILEEQFSENQNDGWYCKPCETYYTGQEIDSRKEGA